MNNNILFSKFSKGAPKVKMGGSNCVIYTRVSSKEQADNNLSLDTQKKACELFAQKNNLQIKGHYGGTYESAKNDERKQFNTMLSFVKKSKEKISHIIVYSVDRFSRSGANAIYIAQQLKTQGVAVCSVTQPTDANTASGSLQQKIHFIFSEYENDQRREKSMAGVKEMLLRGEWCTAPPIGYDVIRCNRDRKIVVNEQGKLLRKMFHWKAKEQITNEEMLRRLAAQGLTLTNKRICEILRNPFYCGLLVHSTLEGRIVDGNHEKLITKELFLEVNQIILRRKQGYRSNPENEETPLKRFIKCDECGQYLRAYESHKTNKQYYKCNTKGCKCNKRADALHEAFKRQLSQYCLEIDEPMQLLIKEQMTATYNQLNEEKEGASKDIERQLAEVTRKIERLEERYVLEEITREMYDKFQSRFRQEKEAFTKELAKYGNKVSNLEEYIDAAIHFSSKLATGWDLGDYADKMALQFLVFPEGMLYNRKNDECRTTRVNEVFSYFARLVSVSGDGSGGNGNRILPFPAPVWATPIETNMKCALRLPMGVAHR